MLWCECRRTKRVEVNFDCLAPSNAVTGLVVTSVDTNCAGLIEYLNLRSAHIAKVLSEKDVKTQPLGVMPG